MSHSTHENTRLKVINYADIHGMEEAACFFNIALETVKRYRLEQKNLRGAPIKNILIFDIETAPMLCYCFGTKKQYISPSQILEDWSILSWSAKWLGEPEIFHDATWLHSKKVRKDKQICKSLGKLLNRADIVVAHYGDGFDIKRVNTRFLFHKLQETTPYKSVDTCKIIKNRFSITYNALDFVGKYLGVGRKVKHEGQELWNKVLAGDKDAQKRMIEYNVGDVTLLEQVYLVIRSWDKRHPNINIQFGERRCPVCGSDNLRNIDDVYTPVSKFSAMICKDCGKYSRTGIHKKTKKDMGMTQRNIL